MAHYDLTVSDPFPGIDELLATLPRWGVCSNKHPDSGASELARLGWRPDRPGLRPSGTQVPAARREATWASRAARSSTSATPTTTATAPGRSAQRSRWRGGTRVSVGADGELVLRDPSEVLELLADPGRPGRAGVGHARRLAGPAASVTGGRGGRRSQRSWPRLARFEPLPEVT